MGVGVYGLFYIPGSHEALMLIFLLGVVRLAICCWPIYGDTIKILKDEEKQCPQCNELCQMELYKKKKVKRNTVARGRGNRIEYEWVEPRVYCTSCGYDVGAEECRDIFPLEETDSGEMEFAPLATQEPSAPAQHHQANVV